MLESNAVLDQLVAIAARAVDAPIAVLGLVIDDVQYFRAAFGLPRELLVSRITGSRDAFCRVVVDAGKPIIVHDATRDKRVARRLATNYVLRAYAGAPVRICGVIIGAICAADRRPRAFDDTVTSYLTSIADVASEELIRERDPERFSSAETLRLWNRDLRQQSSERLSQALRIGSLTCEEYERACGAF